MSEKDKIKKTILKAISLKGKQYFPVHERVRGFHEIYENSETHIVTNNDIIGNFIKIVAKLYVNSDLKGESSLLIPTANIKNADDFAKAETKCVGRALAFMGIGAEYGIASFDDMTEFIQEKEKKEINKEKTAESKKKKFNIMLKGIKMLYPSEVGEIADNILLQNIDESVIAAHINKIVIDIEEHNISRPKDVTMIFETLSSIKRYITQEKEQKDKNNRKASNE